MNFLTKPIQGSTNINNKWFPTFVNDGGFVNGLYKICNNSNWIWFAKNLTIWQPMAELFQNPFTCEVKLLMIEGKNIVTFIKDGGFQSPT